MIFVSIDDNEQHRLRLVMDEIFGEENFYAQLTWESKTKPSNMGRARFKIQENTESILVYGAIPMTNRKNFNLFQLKEKTYPHSDEGGVFRTEEFQQRRNRGSLKRDSMLYSIGGISVKKGYRWQVSPGRYKKLKAENRVIIKGTRVFEKIYKSDEDGFSYEPFWSFHDKNFGTSESGKSDLNEILGIEHEMETVKPHELIKKLIYHSTGKDSIILDSFAGSATTAHAVLALNKSDGGNRKFILVECENYADKITAERVRRVIKGVPAAKDPALKTGLGGRFAYCTLGEEINAEKMLTGENLPDYETLARHLVWLNTGDSPKTITQRKDGFFYETNSRLYHLIYEPNLEFLRSADSALDGDRADRIAKKVAEKGKPAVVFAAAKYVGQKELTKMNITFAALPFAVEGVV
ncbi:MAG: site-specific DNA-methyltransferase [Gammaproteobacteria bacterium]|nr:site-specific DNA-methyltransferase [Gammaproteobacteria bacterium]